MSEEQCVAYTDVFKSYFYRDVESQSNQGEEEQESSITTDLNKGPNTDGRVSKKRNGAAHEEDSRLLDMLSSEKEIEDRKRRVTNRKDALKFVDPQFIEYTPESEQELMNKPNLTDGTNTGSSINGNGDKMEPIEV